MYGEEEIIVLVMVPGMVSESRKVSKRKRRKKTCLKRKSLRIFLTFYANRINKNERERERERERINNIGERKINGKRISSLFSLFLFLSLVLFSVFLLL